MEDVVARLLGGVVNNALPTVAASRVITEKTHRQLGYILRDRMPVCVRKLRLL